MRNYRLFVWDELLTGWRKVEVIIPNILNSIVPIVILTYGFAKLGYLDYSKIISTGFLFSQLMSASIPTVIFLTSDLTFGNVYSYLSLPFSLRGILFVKFFCAYFTSFLISTISFVYPNLTLYKIFDYRLFYVYGMLMAQIVIITGFTLLVSFLMKDITRVGLVLSISSTLLIYLSPVYFPVDVFPAFLRPIIYLNPLTLPVLFLRKLLENQLVFSYLYIIIAEVILYVGLSYYILKRRVNRLR
jgi:lipopolysaccharide transport system permease protein